MVMRAASVAMLGRACLSRRLGIKSSDGTITQENAQKAEENARADSCCRRGRSATEVSDECCHGPTMSRWERIGSAVKQ